MNTSLLIDLLISRLNDLKDAKKKYDKDFCIFLTYVYTKLNDFK